MPKRLRLLTLAALATVPLVHPMDGTAQEEPDSSSLFYHGYDYGSESYYSPLTVFLNKGYEITQLRNHERNFWDFPYGRAWTTSVRESLVHPGTAIDRYGGWGLWLKREVFPLTFDRCCANWFVNWTEHLFGGAVIYRTLDEWFVAHSVPWPKVWAGTTLMAASVMNEVIEHPDAGRGTGTTVADLYVFDVAALFLFSWEAPARFMAKTLQVADWSPMASFTFPNRRIQNNGQYHILKVPLGMERTRLFVRGGMGAQFGISRKLDAEHSFSFGMGADTEVRDVDEETGQETIEMAFSAGVYYDRNNSLLASVAVSPAENLVSVNVYPGVLPGVARDIGVWAVYTRHGDLMAGFAHRRALGLGLGLGW